MYVGLSKDLKNLIRLNSLQNMVHKEKAKILNDLIKLFYDGDWHSFEIENVIEEYAKKNGIELKSPV